MSDLRRASRSLALAAALAAALVPVRGRALTLLDDQLSLDGAPRPAPDLHALPPGAGRPGITVEVAAASPAAKKKNGGAEASPLDFDLLGDAPKAPAVQEDPSERTRRKMLNVHQGLGIGLLTLQLASTVTGQLNYNDKFTPTQNTGQYKTTHQVVTYLNIGAFAATGAFALLAPRAKGPKTGGFGRTTVHKIFMGLATAGMVGQGFLGVETARREGYVDQQSYGRMHLAVGYATLACMAIAVGALVL